MIIIGDVHGEYPLLMKLINKLPHRDLCFSGDLIDRGLYSKDVVEFVKNNNFKCLLGNHESFVIESYDDNQKQNAAHHMWQRNGGKAAIKSYYENSVFNSDLFFEHREWFKTLPIIYWVDNKTVVSHSRYLPFLNDDINDPDVRSNILWSRVHCNHPKTNILNIHGHTITNIIQEKDNYLNIDSGANYYKILTGYDTETKIIYQAKENEEKE